MQTGINPDKALRKKSATKLHRFPCAGGRIEETITLQFRQTGIGRGRRPCNPGAALSPASLRAVSESALLLRFTQQTVRVPAPESSIRSAGGPFRTPAPATASPPFCSHGRRAVFPGQTISYSRTSPRKFPPAVYCTTSPYSTESKLKCRCPVSTAFTSVCCFR